MNDDQITALAREYAEYICTEPMYRWTTTVCNDDIQTETSRARPLLSWLCDRFCLVEKDKVRGEYLLARADYRTSNDVPTVKEYHRGEMSAIDRLFPEIAKEVRNETD